MPATGEVRYQYFVVDPGFTEDKWIQAAECRPGNRAVVHHIIVGVVPPGGDRGEQEIGGVAFRLAHRHRARRAAADAAATAWPS